MELILEKNLDPDILVSNQSFYANQSFTRFIEGQIARAKDDLDKNKPEGNRANARDYIELNGPKIRDVKKRREFLDRRLDHALKCLKRKNLHAETVEDLMAVCQDHDLAHAYSILQVIHCVMGEDHICIEGAGLLDDNCWRIGIDMAMLECEPDLALSESFYGPALEPNIGRIFADTCMAAYASKMTQLINSGNYDELIGKSLMQRTMQTDTFKEMTAELVQDQIADMVKHGILSETRNEQLTESLQQTEDKIKLLKSEKKSIEKSMAPIQSRNKKLETELADLKKEIARLKAENETLQNALSDRDRQLSEYASENNVDILPDLPERNIVFAGGHPNMLKKLMQDHKEWTFIDGKDVNFPEFRTPDAVFFWDKHISHPTFYRVRKFTPASVPQLYMKATNLDMLETEMRKAWSIVLNKQQS